MVVMGMKLPSFPSFRASWLELIELTLGIQSSSQMMISMSNHLRNAWYLGSMKPFSEGEPGSLGTLHIYLYTFCWLLWFFHVEKYTRQPWILWVNKLVPYMVVFLTVKLIETLLILEISFQHNNYIRCHMNWLIFWKFWTSDP